MFGLATFIAGFFNYLYHVVLAHVLGPGSYGDLATFLNVTSLLLLPAPVVALIYTRLGKRSRKARQESLILWSSGIILWGLLVVFRFSVAKILDVPPGLLWVFTLEVVPSLALAANVGILQRARLYLLVGILEVLNTGFRVVAAGGALWSHYRLLAVGILEGVAAWATWGASRWMVRRDDLEGEPSRADVVSGTAVVGVITVLQSITDGILAKHRLGGVQAGLYTGLATIGHSLQFVSGSLGTVMLTHILADPKRSLRYLAVTVGVYAMLAGFGESIFYGAGHGLVLTVLGRPFLPIVPWLSYYGWGMMALGLLNILMLFSVSQSRWEIIGTSGLGFVIWVIWLFHSHSVAAFVTSTTHIMAGTLAASIGVLTVREMIVRNVRPRPKAGG